MELVVSQHAKEAAFLWSLRDHAVHECHYSLVDLAELDARVGAHLDGLRIAANGGWQLCQAALSQEEAGEVFAAGVLALESSDPGRIEEVLEVGCGSEETAPGLISAAGWLPFDKAQRHIRKCLSDPLSEVRRIGIEGFAIHRQDPGRALVAGVVDTDPRLKARALRAVGELARLDLRRALQRELSSEEEDCRYWAAWSCALLGDRSGMRVLASFAESDFDRMEDAARMALRIMDPQSAQRWLEKLRENPAWRRRAITGAGALGDPALVPWIIEPMDTPEHARVAGEAFSMITGVDIAYEDLEGDWPEGFEAGPNDNPEDENVEMNQDENLPWPERELVEKWWHVNKQRFQPGVRHLCGKPITEDHMWWVLEHGYQRQRAAAAIELALLKPGRPLFNVKAPAWRQMELIRQRRTA